MRVECEKCHRVYNYDAERYDYEPLQCDCGHINYVMDWEG